MRKSGYGGGPVLLVVDVRKQVGEVCSGFVHIDVADFQLTIHNQLIAQHVAVQILAAVAVVIADEIDDITVGDGVHSLGQGLGLAVLVDPADAYYGAIGVGIGKLHNQFCPVAVVKNGNSAGDAVAGAVIHGGFVVVGHRLLVDGQPGHFGGSQQVAVLVKVVDGVHTHVDVTFTVIVEQVGVERLHQLPLFFRQGDAAVGPDQIAGVKGIFGQILQSLLIAEGTTAEEAGVAAGEAGDGAIIAVSNDPSNLEIALLMLQKVGLITLGEKTGDFFTEVDIIENPKNIKLVMAETINVAKSIDDADAVISFAFYAVRAGGVEADDFLAENETDKEECPVGIIVRDGDQTAEWATYLAKTLLEDKWTDKADALYPAGCYPYYK